MSLKQLNKEVEEAQKIDRSLRRLKAIRRLIAVGFIAEKLGELFQEAAALVFIFVPLELWDRRDHGGLIEWSLVGTFVLFWVGMAFRFLSVLAYRFKKDLEGVHANI